MAVTEQTPVAESTANGITTVFPFDFLVPAAADLVVKVDNVPKTFGVDYTLTGLGDETGGACTFTTAPAADSIVTLYRDTTLTRDTDYQRNGDLLAATLNADMDRVWLALQEIIFGNKGNGNAVRAPNGEPISELPAAASRANKVLSFDATGQPELILAEAHVLDTQAPEVGGVIEQVNIWIQRERLHPAQFGCSSGTAADQTTNFQKAINAASLRGMPLNLQGKQWRLDAASQLIVPLGGLELENGIIYGNNSPAATYQMSTAGAIGTAINVTAGVSLYATTLQLTTTAGRSVGEMMLLRSADMWVDNGAGLTVTKGEWVTIKSIDSGAQVSLTRPVQDSYATTIRLYPVSMVDHLIMTDMHFTGAGDGANQNCLQANLVNTVRVYNSDARKFAARGFAYIDCPHVDIDGGLPGEGQDSLGLSYGHVISGATLTARAKNVRGDRLRHVVTAGGSTGVVRGYRVEGISGDAMTDATVDAHPAVDDFTAQDIRHVGDAVIGTDGDGIVSQARHTQINDYYLVRPGRHGILVQPACRAGKGTVKIGKGVVRAHGSYSGSCAAVIIALDIANNSGLSQASVDGLDAESTETNAVGLLYLTSVAACDYGNINARIVTPGRALYVYSQAGNVAKHIQVVGGYYQRTNTTAEVMLLEGASLGDVSFTKFQSAHVQGGNYGIRGINSNNDMVAHMSIKGYTVAAINGISNGVNGAIVTAADNQT